MANEMPDFLKDLMGRAITPEQAACQHMRIPPMADGRFFCPLCRLVSSEPLGGA